MESQPSLIANACPVSADCNPFDPRTVEGTMSNDCHFVAKHPECALDPVIRCAWKHNALPSKNSGHGLRNCITANRSDLDRLTAQRDVSRGGRSGRAALANYGQAVHHLTTRRGVHLTPANQPNSGPVRRTFRESPMRLRDLWPFARRPTRIEIVAVETWARANLITKTDLQEAMARIDAKLDEIAMRGTG